MAPFDLTGPYDIHRDGVPDPPPSAAATPLIPQFSRLLIELAEQREGLIVYLQQKVKAGDYHAVQDAASDIREVEAQMTLIKELLA